VDDEMAFLEVATHFLQKVGGFEVHCATSVRSAKEMLSKDAFDVVVSDYQMPETDGIEFLKLLRAGGSQIPFILFTGKGREDVVIEALNQGADFYLQKGGDIRSQFHELAGMISQAVEGTRASTQLVESQERFRRLADSISDALVAMDDDLRITFWNNAAKEVIGIDSHDAIGRSALDLVPEIRDSHFGVELKAARESRYMRTTTWEISRAGRRRSFDVRIYPGEEGLLVVARDTTDTRAAARMLEESEDRYKSLVESLPDAIIVFSIDRIVYANPAAVRIYGGDDESDLVGKRIFDLIPPEYAAETADRIRKMHEVENPLPSRIMKVYTKSGDTLDMEVSSTPITYSGKMAVQTVLRDVTERRKTEQRMRVHQNELKTILDSVPAMIVYQDREGRLISANKSFVETTGIDEGQWRGKTVEEALPGLGEIFSSRNKEVLRTRRSQIGVLIPFQAAAGVRWARTDKMPYVDEVGEVVGVITVAEDITDQLEVERRLARQRVMLDNVEDAVMFLDPGFVIEYWNRAAERVYGFTAEEVIGRDARDVLETDYLKNDPQGLSERLARDGHVEVVFRQKRKDGEWIPVDSMTVSLKDSNGTVTGYGAINRDISNRMEAEAAIKASEEKFSKAFKASPVMMFMTRLRDGMVIDANDALVRFSGYKKEELVGKTTLELGIVDASQREMFMKTLSKGQPLLSEQGHYRTKSGELRKAEYSAEVIEIAGEKVMLTVATDLTEKELMISALEKSEDRFRMIAETSKDCVFRFGVSPELKAEYVSPGVETITGYSPEEFYADPGLIAKMIAVGDDEDLVKELAMSDHDSPPVTRRCVRKDGRVVWIEESATPVFKDGELIAVQGVARDVTERKNYEEALKKANKKLNLLGSITRHDSLNQLGILKGWLTAAIEQETDDAVRAMLLKVRGAADSLKMHLEFTSQYKSLGMKRPAWMPLAEIVSKVTEGLGRQGIAVASEVEGIEVYADPMLENVFRNLVNNSISHGETVDSISVSFREVEGGLVVTYEDNGIGIPIEEKEKVFERGYGSRHGYGLYLSREILSLTGATIKEAGTFKKGARFEVHIPLDNWRRKG
jgi:PAS domain S-box-containing protein